MQKFCYVLSLTIICYWTEASPVSLGTLEFDKLSADIDDLKYEVEEEDLDDYSKFLDDKESSDDSKNGKSKEDEKSSDSKNSKTDEKSKGEKAKYDIGDLKKFFKAVGVTDKGSYNLGDIYAAIAALATEAVGSKAKVERKFKKGTKTKGFHKVHHKDEYKKDKEFYEEDETSGEFKKVGGKALGFKAGAGAGVNKGHFHRDHTKGIYGKEGYLGKGFLDKEFSGYSDAEGYGDSFKNDSF